jgi:hypothetical protein
MAKRFCRASPFFSEGGLFDPDTGSDCTPDMYVVVIMNIMKSLPQGECAYRQKISTLGARLFKILKMRRKNFDWENESQRQGSLVLFIGFLFQYGTLWSHPTALLHSPYV